MNRLRNKSALSVRMVIVYLLLVLIRSTSLGQDGFVGESPKLAYWQIGHKREVVIMLHGGPAAQHEYLRPEFDGSRKAATVIYCDQRGCGRSERASSYEWRHHVNDLHRLIQSLAPTKKVYLAGSSWGSTLAMMYAYKHPEHVKGLILTGTYPWEGKGLTGYQYQLHMRSFYNTDIFVHKKDFYEHRITWARRKARPDTSTISKTVEIYGGPAFGQTRLSFASAPVLDSLRKIRVPTLIFNGTRQCEITDWGHRYVEISPNATLHTINGACHDPWLSNPDVFFTTCNRFIEVTRKN
ncbi:alpha/beta fold hydrolase [Spirosoma fluminis]